MNPQHVVCNLCGRDDYRVLEQDGEFRVGRCKNCELIYVDPQPEPERLSGHYDEEYYAPWLKDQMRPRKIMWKRRLKKLEKIARPGRILDVGCGCGLFLDEAKKGGWEVSGVEISRYGVEYAKKVFGIDVFHGQMRQARFPASHFDVITFWHSIEHTTDPLAHLREAARVLKPGGVVVVAVPNIQNYIVKIAYKAVKRKPLKYFERNDREIHIYHFSMRTMALMLKKAGFEPIRFGVDAERIYKLERWHDLFCAVLFAVTRINLGMAFEVYARKKD